MLVSCESPWRSCYVGNHQVVRAESQRCGWQYRKAQPSEAAGAKACLGRWLREGVQGHRDWCSLQSAHTTVSCSDRSWEAFVDGRLVGNYPAYSFLTLPSLPGCHSLP